MLKQKYMLTFLLLWQCVAGKNLLEIINSNPDFSKVRDIIQKSGDRRLEFSLQDSGLTFFAPTNEAIEKYEGLKDEKLIRYHMSNLAFRIQDIEDEIKTELPGNPVLYVTRIPSGRPSVSGWENNDYYINNAKIISANIPATSSHKHKLSQYIHKIDEVIRPTVERGRGQTYPDAATVLHEGNKYGFENELSNFDRRVSDLKEQDSFLMKGRNTFFIPVTKQLKNFKKNVIDKQVIHGHIVPDEVLFTRTVRDRTKQFKTMAFENNLKVYITISNVTNDNKETAYYVTSNIVSGNSGHKNGSALARIVKGNIPVSNGVIHLIDRPLMVVASSIMNYLQEEDGQLNKFHKLMSDHYPDLENYLSGEQKGDVTLFAPSNEAFDMVNQKRLDRVIANQDKFKKMMNLHIVTRRLSMDEIIDGRTKEVQTRDPDKDLYFSVSKLRENEVMHTVTLEGAGVNATIRTPNVVAKNGIIHIIDRILGVPSQTVYEKLGSDPQLSKTFQLVQQGNFNKDLDDRTKKFTFFAPNNDAWRKIEINMPSAYKKLFGGKFGTHTRNILQRHRIANSAMPIAQLEGLISNNQTEPREDLRQRQLQMTRDTIYFQAKVMRKFGDYSLEWHGLHSQIVRRDLECVNGIVHVIDNVLMAERDVTVSSASTFPSLMAETASIISIILAWILV